MTRKLCREWVRQMNQCQTGVTAESHSMCLCGAEIFATSCFPSAYIAAPFGIYSVCLTAEYRSPYFPQVGKIHILPWISWCIFGSSQFCRRWERNPRWNSLAYSIAFKVYTISQDCRPRFVSRFFKCAMICYGCNLGKWWQMPILLDGHKI